MFVEASSEYAAELSSLPADYPHLADRIQILHADANVFLRQWSRSLHRLDRAVVFLDPYGMAVEWSTVEALAATKKVDLWVLFPLGVAINRLLTRKQPPRDTWAAALTRFFGTEDWKTAFYKPNPQPSLFGDESTSLTKEADFDSIGGYFIRRLQSVFEGVAPNSLALRNSRNSPLFLLCFAVGNPVGKETAIRIANHILRR